MHLARCVPFYRQITKSETADRDEVKYVTEVRYIGINLRLQAEDDDLSP